MFTKKLTAALFALILLAITAAPSSAAAVPAPANVAAVGLRTENGPRIAVTWTDTEGAVGYDVYRMNGEGDFLRVSSTVSPRYEDAVILKNTVYLYRVAAVFADRTRSRLSPPVPGIYCSATGLTMNESVGLAEGREYDMSALGVEIFTAAGVPAAEGEVRYEVTGGESVVIEDGVLKTVTYGMSEVTAVIDTACTTCRVYVAPPTDAPVDVFREWVLNTWRSPVRVDILKVRNTDRGFGSSRNGGERYHAGMDYYVRGGDGTPVYAMTDGRVVDIVSNFFGGTSAVIVRNDDGSLLLYGEIRPSVKVGDRLTGGRTKVGAMKKNSVNGGTMLHLELYRGTVSGYDVLVRADSYSFVKDRPYNRRSDLMDPEFLLGL